MVTKPKARKNYICANCGWPIARGQQYICIKKKEPTYDLFNKQIGIQYIQQRQCLNKMACNLRMVKGLQWKE